MTDQEIKDRVEGWNWNLSIFEIYDEVKEMGKWGYGGHNASELADLSRLLTHAYDFFNHDPMIMELASFLGAEITAKVELTTAS